MIHNSWRYKLDVLKSNLCVHHNRKYFLVSSELATGNIKMVYHVQIDKANEKMCLFMTSRQVKVGVFNLPDPY